MLLNLTNIRARRCVNCFQHDFVVQDAKYCLYLDSKWILKSMCYTKATICDVKLKRMMLVSFVEIITVE